MCYNTRVNFRLELVFTKFNVGYPKAKREGFVDGILKRREHIGEVYFSFGDMTSGRGLQDDVQEFSWETTARQLDDLGKLSAAGIPLDLLLNGNCYGQDSLARSFFMKLGDTVDYIAQRFILRAVTTTSPIIAKFIRDNFAGLDIRASVNLGIGTKAALDATASMFDSFYLKREYNRDMDALLSVKAWCDANGKQLYLLANSGCMNECPMRTFHDNLVAHEHEIARTDNAYVYRSLCRTVLENSANRASIVRDMNYIRPEDMHLYEGLVTAAKLATRVSADPLRTLDAYIEGRYIGAITDLLEPNNGAAFGNAIVDNSRFPKEFGERVAHCQKKCDACGYCAAVYENALVELDKYDIF